MWSLVALVDQEEAYQSLIPHEEYIITNRILQTQLIQLHEIANEIITSTGSEFDVHGDAVVQARNNALKGIRLLK